MRTTKWRDLLAAADAKTPSRAEGRDERVAALLARHDAYQHTLGELRKARGATQATLAANLGMSQSEISKLEHRADAYLSSLQEYVRGLGGELRLVAVFGEEEFVLKLQDLVTDDVASDMGSKVDAVLVAGEPAGV